MENPKPNTWRVTRVVNAQGTRSVMTLGEYRAENAQKALEGASRLGDDCGTFHGTQAHGELVWGDLSYRAVPVINPKDPRAAEKVKRVKEAQQRAKLSEFFPALRHA